MRVLNKAKKSLGQNFLIDKNIIKKKIKIGNIDKKKTIIEIGAGYGSLTKELASFNPKKIYAVEKDKKLVSFLKDKFKNHANIKIDMLITGIEMSHWKDHSYMTARTSP